MPNKDKTGPQGLGPKTGRQMGSCEDATQLVGRGLGRCGSGQGFGRLRQRRNCCPNRYIAGFSKEEEKKILEAELSQIDSERKDIERRISELN